MAANTMAFRIWLLPTLWLSAFAPGLCQTENAFRQTMVPFSHFNGSWMSSRGASYFLPSKIVESVNEQKVAEEGFFPRGASSAKLRGVVEHTPSSNRPAIGVTTVVVNGPGDRPLRTLVWYPADAPTAQETLNAYKYFGVIPSKHAREDAPAASGVFPLIVISHGSGCSPEFHFVQAEAFALQGYIVAAPTHTGNDPINGSLSSNLLLPYFRPLDISAVLDFLESSSDGTKLGKTRFPMARPGAVVLGHSYGGYTALALAGFPFSCDYVVELARAAGMPLDMVCSGLPADLTSRESLRDPRIIGAVALDPGPLFPFAAASKAKVPGLLFSGAFCTNSPPLIGFRNETEMYYSRWAAEHGRVFSVIKNAAHMSFTNFCEFLGYGIASAEVEAFYKEYVCAFVDPDNQQVLDIVQNLSEAFAGALLRHEREGWAALASKRTVPAALRPFLDTFDTEGLSRSFTATL